MFLKTFPFYFKWYVFFIKKIKANNVKKRESILCNQFYWPLDNSLKHYVQWKHKFRYRINKINRKEGDVCKCKDCKWIQTTLLLMPRYIECSSMLNAASVTNAFLSYTWLSMFFLWCFFSTSWLHFYFTGYLIMYWWKRTPCVVVVVTRKPSRKRRYVE